MSTDKEIKNCLVITYGPVPTPQYQTVEGGGMRAWGLAQGLVKNGVEVTVAVNSGYPQESIDHEGIHLTNWSLDDEFKYLINTFDTVIISYCMGDVSDFVAKNVEDHIQLILDVYVPIYVEVSARDSENIDSEYAGYMQEIQRYNRVLKRGDFFLCANEVQKIFYTGVLSSLGIINPSSYREQQILIVPFGIGDEAQKSVSNPYKKLGIPSDDFVVLWFGGLYPWFRIEEYLGAIKQLKSDKKIKFVIVGSKNPFNTNEDFIRQHTKAYKFAEDNNLLNQNMFFVDWVDFNDRINWYKHADVVISLNQPGEENGFSWRTRVMDYVWGEMAIITNGGDPLSNELIEEDSAIRLNELSSKEIAKIITNYHNKPDALNGIQKNIKNLKKKYYWSTVTRPVAEVIENASKLKRYGEKLEYSKSLGIDIDPFSNKDNTVSKGRVGRLAHMPVKVISKASVYTKKHGLRSTVKYSLSLLSNRAKPRLSNSKPNYIFISHPINNTGAPLVLMQVIEEFAQKYGSSRVKVIAPNITSNNQSKLKKLGIRISKAAGAFSDKIIRFQLALKPDDFVLINTIAIHENYRVYIFNELKAGRLKQANWFIHEDEAQISLIAPQLLEKRNIEQISKLINTNKLKVFVPSKRTQEEYNKIFVTKKVQTLPLRLDIDSRYSIKRKDSDYSELNFLLSGSPSDGRKGQLIAIAAFNNYLEDYYRKNPKNYRPFKLHLVSIGDDYISEQIKWIGESLLKDKIKLYPSVTYKEALEITAKCNAVICCSLNETFALYVAEGMYMGHVILRNDSSGIDEQLRDGKNGYKIDHTDINQFSAAIEKLLNKKTNSNHDLQMMGGRSQTIIEPFIHNTYLEKITKEV